MANTIGSKPSVNSLTPPASGLIASCVRTSVFYNSEETIKTDPLCKHGPRNPARRGFHLPFQTVAESTFSWTVVECGMYFSAACLIGLRPLFSRLPRWIKDRVLHESDERAEHTYNTYGSGATRLRDKDPYASIITNDREHGGGRGDRAGTPLKIMHQSSFTVSSSPSPPTRGVGEDGNEAPFGAADCRADIETGAFPDESFYQHDLGSPVVETGRSER